MANLNKGSDRRVGTYRTVDLFAGIGGSERDSR